MGIVERPSFLVTHGYLKLVQPDARVDGQPLPAHRLERNGSRDGMEERP